MRRIASAGYETLTPDDCLEVVDFIEKNGDDRAISMRLLEPSFRKVIYARSEGLDWRPLVMTQLRPSDARKTRPAASTPGQTRYDCSIRRSSSSPTPWANSRCSGAGPRARAGLRSSGSSHVTVPLTPPTRRGNNLPRRLP